MNKNRVRALVQLENHNQGMAFGTLLTNVVDAELSNSNNFSNDISYNRLGSGPDGVYEIDFTSGHLLHTELKSVVKELLDSVKVELDGDGAFEDFCAEMEYEDEFVKPVIVSFKIVL